MVKGEIESMREDGMLQVESMGLGGNSSWKLFRLYVGVGKRQNEGRKEEIFFFWDFTCVEI